ncbi:MAG: hypothetical protein GSR84_06470 [Desulfurococcales archaeon]|nr:hypothetical protein [Desulfurococcales archaeon]
MEHLGSIGGALALVEAIAAAAFTVIAYRLYIVYSRLREDPLESGLAGFTLLAASSLAMMIASLASSPRASLSIYVASSILAVGGFYLLSPLRGMTVVIPLGGLKVLVALFDYLAGIMGFTASQTTRGPARVLLAIIALSYMVRGTSMLGGALGMGPASVALALFVGELLRAASAAALAVFYATLGGNGEEEEE